MIIPRLFRRAPGRGGRLLLAMVVLCTAASAGWAADDGADVAGRPVALTTAGRVRGYRDGEINAFKGIPYGGDTALRRFRAPVAPPAWDGIRDATDYGPRAPQPEGRGPASRGGPAQAESEDCLRLNVWSPGMRDAKRRPVLVYFHGGAYNAGSVNDAVYDGVRLARRGDVVVVTVNHRLNGFGYLYLAELDAADYAESGNAGMLDLVLALHWVRDNIAEFGGDADNVTIFGQSGGGAKCATLMAMPSAHGLFHRVWTMSGQQITGRTREHAAATAGGVLAALNLTEERVRELDTMPLERLKAAMRNGAWTPVVDGGVLPRDPFAPDASPLSAAIPMVMGNTHDETTNLIGGRDPAMFALTWETLPGKLAEQVQTFIGTLEPRDIVAEYRRMYPDYGASDVFFAATTAARSWKSMVVQADARAVQAGAPLFVYYLNWQSPADGGKWKAPHALDIPLVFDNVAADRLTAGAGADGQAMADLMSEALIAFARTGSPQTAALPRWPRYDFEWRPSLLFERLPRVENDPRGEERRLFAPVPYVQPGT